MIIDKKSRSDLKEYFRRNKIPTESNFAELIDGMLNHKDDGIAKIAGNPLSIQADDSAQKKTLNFYDDLQDETPAWSLSLNPTAEPANPASPSNAGLSFSDSAGNSRLFIDQSTGNVGVGTILPQEKLHVAGNIHIDGAIHPSAGNSEGNGIMFPKNPAGGGGDAAWIRYYAKTGESTVLEVGTSNDTNDHIIFKTNGSVGVGNINPAGDYRLIIGQKESKSGHGIRLLNANSTKSCQLWVGRGGAVIDAEGSTNLHLRTAGQERIKIENSGNINIAPTSNLSFGSKTRQMINLWNTNYGIGIQSHTMYFRTASNYAWYMNGSHSNTRFSPGSGGHRLMALNSVGDLILSGRTNPTNSPTGSSCRALVDKTNKLHINYANDFSGGLFTGGKAFKPNGGAWGSTSDIRLKKDINALQGSLDKLLKLRGVNFKWKEPEKQGNLTGVQTGFIAHEIEKVFPEWVDTDEDEFKTLSISGFEALTVEAFRDLYNQLNEIRSKLNELNDST